MKLKNVIRKLLLATVAATHFFQTVAIAGEAEGIVDLSNLSYDRGMLFEPNLDYEQLRLNDPSHANYKMHKELFDIIARIPNMPGISSEMTKLQWFRGAFGPTLWRMILQPDSIKILFEGQDGTHKAEAAGYTATAGFGGRGQNVAEHLGAKKSAGFFNFSFYTMKYQYGNFDTPVVVHKDGKTSLEFRAFVDTDVWQMTQDPNSLMAQVRNDFIDWLLRYHKNSLKLFIFFGGAARDTLGSFLESKKAKVAAKVNEEDLKNLEVPLHKTVPSVSNKTVAVPITEKGEDIYLMMIQDLAKNGNELGLKTLEKFERKHRQGREQKRDLEFDYSDEDALNLAKKELEKLVAAGKSPLVFTKAGIHGSGVFHPAQMGGYNFKKISVPSKQGSQTIWTDYSNMIKDIPLSDGTLSNPLLMLDIRHPTVLSMTALQQGIEAASKMVRGPLESIRWFFEEYGYIEADPGVKNEYKEKIPYKYGRTTLDQAYYALGTPLPRMADKSDAFRDDANEIIDNTRDQKVEFDEKQIKLSELAEPSRGLDMSQLLVDRDKSPDGRYITDSNNGITNEWANIVLGLDLRPLSKPKAGMTDKDGIDAYIVKTHPTEVGPFGHYRGLFKNSKVLILADPDGYDDYATSRALTGARGQYLHGLMEDLKIGDKYGVIKTIPFGMDGATPEEWSEALKHTREYRRAMLELYIKNNKPQIIITDGPYAKAEIESFLGKNNSIKVVSINRKGLGNNTGIVEAAPAIAKSLGINTATVTGKPSMIPRSHLPFNVELWQGTFGDRVFTATDKYKGIAFDIVVPNLVQKQNLPLTELEKANVKEQEDRVVKAGFPKFKEVIADYLLRRSRELGIEKFWKQGASAQKEEKPRDNTFAKGNNQERTTNSFTTSVQCVQFYSR